MTNIQLDHLRQLRNWGYCIIRQPMPGMDLQTQRMSKLGHLRKLLQFAVAGGKIAFGVKITIGAGM